MLISWREGKGKKERERDAYESECCDASRLPIAEVRSRGLARWESCRRVVVAVVVGVIWKMPKYKEMHTFYKIWACLKFPEMLICQK